MGSLLLLFRFFGIFGGRLGLGGHVLLALNILAHHFFIGLPGLNRFLIGPQFVSLIDRLSPQSLLSDKSLDFGALIEGLVSLLRLLVLEVAHALWHLKLVLGWKTK